MSNIFKRLISSSSSINEEEELLKNDPVEKMLERKKIVPQTIEEDPLKVAAKKIQLPSEPPKIEEIKKSVPKDPLLRLIQGIPEPEVESNSRSQKAGSWGQASKPSAQKQTMEVAEQPQAGGPVAKQEAAEKAVQPDASVQAAGESSLRPSEKSTDIQPPPRTAQIAAEPALTVKPVPAAEVKTVPVSQEKPVQAVQEKKAAKKGAAGDVMDIFKEEDKKVKNETLSSGLENIEGQLLLDEAEGILATLRSKHRF